MIKRKNAFTLVELVAVLVIMAIIALIATPLILTLVNKSKASANKRSVDAYGKAVEISIMRYLINKEEYPENLSTLEVEYTGKKVVCNEMTLNTDGSLYLSECSVGGAEVKDKNTEDGWYHYGKIVTSIKKSTAVDILLEKANDSSGTTYEEGSDESHEMYTFKQEATDQTEALTDYRYIGSDPYNYVTFNNETWRIIGLFTVEGADNNQEQRIKIIREKQIGEYAWDLNGVNEWTTASLNNYLNGQYYNSLTNEAQRMIASTKFYLGGINGAVEGTASNYYAFERGKNVQSGRSINWIGKIGLFYPSDYVYSRIKSGWLYTGDDQWTISPSFANGVNSFYEGRTGYVYNTKVNYTEGVRPSLYLLSDIQIVEGNGSQESPYELKLG